MEKMIDISGDLIDNEKNVYEKYSKEGDERIKKRYSIEYCGMKYMLIERTQEIIIKESKSYKKLIEYAKNNNITLIEEEVK